MPPIPTNKQLSLQTLSLLLLPLQEFLLVVFALAFRPPPQGPLDRAEDVGGFHEAGAEADLLPPVVALEEAVSHHFLFDFFRGSFRGRWSI